MSPASLLTTEIKARLPQLGATENQADPIVQVKFFTPDAQWSWFATEFDGEDTFFGYVQGDFPELGYFSLSEIQAVRGRLGLPVESDKFFEPVPLSRVQ